MPLPETQITNPRVWVDQELCTGDGLCVQLVPEVFEFDVDGLAYVKGPDGELRTDPGATVEVAADLRADVAIAAHDCPGRCIFIEGEQSDAGAAAG
jgi:ferredoxin